MEELTNENILKFWEDATVEQQRENIDRVLEIIPHHMVLKIWLATKTEIKSENPNLIIRIIRQKLDFGNIYLYIPDLWRNTPQDVQEKTIDELIEIYTSEQALENLWEETHESVKESKKEVLARVLNYDEESLKKFGIPECIPAPTGMLGKNQIDDIIFGLKQQALSEARQSDYTEVIIKMSEIPSTSIPYFFKQISEDITPNYIKLFWDSIEKDVQYMVVADVLRHISSEELKRQMWNELAPEKQKAKIKELLTNKELKKAIDLIGITGNQINKEMLDDMINGNDSNEDRENIVVSIWGILPEEIQMEYFDTAMEIYGDELDDSSEKVWEESSEQVQRSNFQKYLKTMNDTEQIIGMLNAAKFPRTEVIDYILQEYQGAQLEEIIDGYLLDVPSLEKLKGKISSDVSIKLVIKNAAELPNKKLKKLCENFNIKTIQMQDDNLDMQQMEPYDLATYIKCRAIIDNKLLKGIDLAQNPNDPNREKKNFRTSY